MVPETSPIRYIFTAKEEGRACLIIHAYNHEKYHL